MKLIDWCSVHSFIIIHCTTQQLIQYVNVSNTIFQQKMDSGSN